MSPYEVLEAQKSLVAAATLFTQIPDVEATPAPEVEEEYAKTVPVGLTDEPVPGTAKVEELLIPM